MNKNFLESRLVNYYKIRRQKTTYSSFYFQPCKYEISRYCFLNSFQRANALFRSFLNLNSFVDLKNFDSDLRLSEKAAQFSLENIMTDLRDLEKGMDLASKELNNRTKDKSKPPQSLQDFVIRGGEVVQRIRQKGEAAQVTIE